MSPAPPVPPTPPDAHAASHPDEPGPITPIPLPERCAPPGGGLTLLMLGGTFDPPHMAHALLPLRASEAMGLGDHLLVFVPASRSPHKAAQPLAPADHRLAMLHRLIDDLSLRGRAVAWSDEIDRAAAAGPAAAPSYTAHTLARARRWLDGHGVPAAVMRLVIGADQALAFDRWRDPRAILAIAQPLVLPRGEPPERTLARMSAGGAWSGPEMLGWARGFAPIEPRTGSSTDIRALLAGAGPAGPGGLSPGVLEHIRVHGLYGAGGAGSAAGPQGRSH